MTHEELAGEARKIPVNTFRILLAEHSAEKISDLTQQQIQKVFELVKCYQLTLVDLQGVCFMYMEKHGIDKAEKLLIKLTGKKTVPETPREKYYKVFNEFKNGVNKNVQK